MHHVVFVVILALLNQLPLVTPSFTPLKQGSKSSFGSHIGARLVNNLKNWELRVPIDNPGFIQMFYDRDIPPFRPGMTPWQGEFIGKYLCAAINSWKILRDDTQEQNIHAVVDAWLQSQSEDGYLGTFSQGGRLLGSFNWDCWSHMWAIRSLLMYNTEFNSPRALQAAIKAADLIIKTYVAPNIPMTNDGNWGQSNYAIIHAFALMFEATKDIKYLDAAVWVIEKWDQPGAGLYLKLALQGKEMFEFVGNRWESMHNFIGLYETYLITGNKTYIQVFQHIYKSILKGDRHATGGFSTSEHTTGNPFQPGAIETCATVSWQDMSIHLLRLTESSIIADEIELTFWNAIVGAQTRIGSWWTYDTPLVGNKISTYVSLGSQAGPGGPLLTCCSVNGPRGLSMVVDWAYMLDATGSGIVINFYGPSSITTQTSLGPLTIIQTTDYPRQGNITIEVDSASSSPFSVKLRIPSWSTSTKVDINGVPVDHVQPGTYLSINKRWNKGDIIHLSLDMSLHYWAGEMQLLGSSMMYRGPILLAYEQTYNPNGFQKNYDALTITSELVPASNHTIPPIVLVAVHTQGSDDIEYLVDFATAGAYGNFYTAQHNIANVPVIPFNESWPIWTNIPHK